MVQTDQVVERLVRENEKLVQFAVNRYLRRYSVPGMEREDLVSWGLMGLVHAARAWDPSRAGSFATLAYKAIERMIVRGVMREWKPEQASVTVSMDELLFEEGPDARETRFVDQVADDQDVEQEMLDGEARAAIRRAVAGLTPPQRRLIERHFFEEISLAMIADEMGLSRQGAYMQRRDILRKLRAALSPTVPGAA